MNVNIANMQLPRETQEILHAKFQNIIRMLETDRTIGTDSMSEITPHVYVSGLSASLDLDTLKDEKIRSILFLCEDNKSPKILKQYAKKKIEHCHISLEDLATRDLTKIFQTTYAYIRERVEKGTKILVHCAAGMSRSVIVVAHYYLVRFYVLNHTNKKVQKKICNPRKYFSCKILNMIKDNRPCIGPNPGFLRQLLVVEYCLKRKFRLPVSEAEDSEPEDSESEDSESEDWNTEEYDVLADLKKIAPSSNS